MRTRSALMMVMMIMQQRSHRRLAHVRLKTYAHAVLCYATWALAPQALLADQPGDTPTPHCCPPQFNHMHASWCLCTPLLLCAPPRTGVCPCRAVHAALSRQLAGPTAPPPAHPPPAPGPDVQPQHLPLQHPLGPEPAATQPAAALPAGPLAHQPLPALSSAPSPHVSAAPSAVAEQQQQLLQLLQVDDVDLCAAFDGFVPAPFWGVQQAQAKAGQVRWSCPLSCAWCVHARAHALAVCGWRVCMHARRARERGRRVAEGCPRERGAAACC